MSHCRLATSPSMDIWLDGGGRSDLYSDEGTLFGHLGIGEWDDVEGEMCSWRLRKN